MSGQRRAAPPVDPSQWSAGGARPGAVALTRDAPAQVAADRLAALAAQAAEAPTALVQLVDGGLLRLHGGFGLPGGWEALRAVPLEDTLAGVIFDSGFPLIIEDVSVDPRVPQRAPVRAVAAQAYVGCPVLDADDAIVGVCAVLDYRPRTWTAAALTAVDRAAQACGALVAAQAAQHRADRQRAFLDTVLDSLHDGVAAYAPDGTAVLTNAAMRQMAPGFPARFRADRMPPELDLRHPDGRTLDPDRLPVARALRGERVTEAELAVRLPGSRQRIFLVSAQPLAQGDGAPAGAVVTAHEVTERRRAERFRDCQAAVSAALADAASAEQAGPGVLAAVAGTLGWSHAELWLVDESGEALRPAATWTVPERAAGVTVPDQLTYGTGLVGRAWQIEQPLWISDVGQPRSLVSGPTAETSGLRSGLAVPVRSGPGTMGVLAFFADTVEDPADSLVALLSGVAAHVGQFLERRRAEELSLQLAHSKDEYLALIGHEMRTPLTSIGAYAELLRGADAETLVREGPTLLGVIERNATALRGIIDDLLDLAALDTGYAEVRVARCDLARVVREAADAARPALDGTPLAMRLDAPDRLVVDGDPARLRQVVDNLLGNAIKYSPDGGEVEVALAAVGDRAAELRVSDSGIGIPAAERDRLFTRFYRSSTARHRAIPGSGLGLALSRAIVERHHGTIQLVLRDGPGTCIAVRLPTAQPPAAPPPAGRN